jgi:hypothetical protein
LCHGACVILLLKDTTINSARLGPVRIQGM